MRLHPAATCMTGRWRVQPGRSCSRAVQKSLGRTWFSRLQMRLRSFSSGLTALRYRRRAVIIMPCCSCVKRMWACNIAPHRLSKAASKKQMTVVFGIAALLMLRWNLRQPTNNAPLRQVVRDTVMGCQQLPCQPITVGSDEAGSMQDVACQDWGWTAGIKRHTTPLGQSFRECRTAQWLGQ